MSRNRKRGRSRPQQRKAQPPRPKPEPEAQPPEAAPDESAVRASLREDFGLVVRQTANYIEEAAGEIDEVLHLLLEALQSGRMSDELRAEFDMRLISAGVEVAAVAEVDDDSVDDEIDDTAVREEVRRIDEEESEEEDDERIEAELDEERYPARPADDYELDELAPPQMAATIPVFEQGPLAAGILMLDAMLTEAKSGYIVAQISALEQAINEEFEPHERELMVDAAAKWRDANGLPDVPAAYQALVVYRATTARA